MKTPGDKVNKWLQRQRKRSISKDKASGKKELSQSKSKSNRKKRSERDRSNDTPNNIETNIETTSYSPFRSGLVDGEKLKVGDTGVRAVKGFSMSGNQVKPGLKLAFGTIAVNKKLGSGFGVNLKS